MFSLVIAFLVSALLSWVMMLPVLWALKVFRLSQFIRPEGPSSHEGKKGTPTMGGIGMIVSFLVMFLVLVNFDIDLKFLSLIFLFLGFGVLGLTDDLLKIKRRRNLGVPPLRKLFFQVLIASLFAAVMVYMGRSWGVGGLLLSMHFNVPYLYFPFLVFVIVGTSNSVNLADGLDGLAAGVLSIAFLAFAVVAYRLQLADIALVSVLASGVTFAFLRFNFHPAEVFMGDVGSLSFGALLAGIAILLHAELLLAVIGLVFVVEALSVIVQVFCFKIFRLRVFRMSPLHHHFELMGFSEPLIVASFYSASVLFGLLGVFLYRIL